MVAIKLTSVLNNFHNIAKECISDVSKILLNLDLPRPLPCWQDKIQEWERSNTSKLTDGLNKVKLKFSISKKVEQNALNSNREVKEAIKTERHPKNWLLVNLSNKG
jgi:hypothetical protein